MIKFDIITIFPEIFDSYFDESIVRRAQKKKLIKISIHNLRDFASDARRTVDDKPYGGGPGMVMKVEPIYKAIRFLKSKAKTSTSAIAAADRKKSKVILFSPKGKKLDQEMAKKLAKLDRLIMICGRYEGVDERVAKHIADEEISIGDYVLTGGELPAMVLIDAVSRLVPGVIKPESLKEESFSGLSREYPQYTRPEIFTVPVKIQKTKPGARKKVYWRAPKILLSGNHKKIIEWRKNKSLLFEKNQKKC